MAIRFADAKKSANTDGSGWIKNGYERLKTKMVLGKKIEIVDVDFVDGNFGEAVIVYLTDGTCFMSSSRTLIDQVKNIIKPVLDGGETVETVLTYGVGRSGRKYLTFT